MVQHPHYRDTEVSIARNHESIPPGTSRHIADTFSAAHRRTEDSILSIMTGMMPLQTSSGQVTRRAKHLTVAGQYVKWA